ncbi:hypothetical protein J6590_000096 [Homalodisca vitripennis]|nr:hypothetical protein J6590_000096 [Homalodisca vitripennis]
MNGNAARNNAEHYVHNKGAQLICTGLLSGQSLIIDLSNIQEFHRQRGSRRPARGICIQAFRASSWGILTPRLAKLFGSTTNVLQWRRQLSTLGGFQTDRFMARYLFDVPDGFRRRCWDVCRPTLRALCQPVCDVSLLVDDVGMFVDRHLARCQPVCDVSLLVDDVGMFVDRHLARCQPVCDTDTSLCRPVCDVWPTSRRCWDVCRATLRALCQPVCDVSLLVDDVGMFVDRHLARCVNQSTDIPRCVGQFVMYSLPVDDVGMFADRHPTHCVGQPVVYSLPVDVLGCLQTDIPRAVSASLLCIAYQWTMLGCLQTDIPRTVSASLLCIAYQ